ncbi:hypothetical protein BJX68DRAFT_142500 [Aspergillus pseudodeflectus]|uniref:Uncharacterized protein n=1 Tax=Aspergillus pseudodeflectus TaxID=176178 RepID=A0ABR4L2U4_9EURO
MPQPRLSGALSILTLGTEQCDLMETSLPEGLSERRMPLSLMTNPASSVFSADGGGCYIFHVIIVSNTVPGSRRATKRASGPLLERLWFIARVSRYPVAVDKLHKILTLPENAQTFMR